MGIKAVKCYGRYRMVQNVNKRQTLIMFYEMSILVDSFYRDILRTYSIPIVLLKHNFANV
jgi:hypothetical protein